MSLIVPELLEDRRTTTHAACAAVMERAVITKLFIFGGDANHVRPTPANFMKDTQRGEAEIFGSVRDFDYFLT